MDTKEESKAKEYWETVFERRKRDIVEVSPIPFKEAGFDDVQTFIQDLVSRHEKKHFSQFLTAITPTLERVNSFANALNTFSSQSKGASLTWGTLQIVIEVNLHHMIKLLFCYNNVSQL